MKIYEIQLQVIYFDKETRLSWEVPANGENKYRIVWYENINVNVYDLKGSG